MRNAIEAFPPRADPPKAEKFSVIWRLPGVAVAKMGVSQAEKY